MDFALQISELLGGLGQFIFGLVAVALSILAFVKKRSDIFRSELAKSQFLEMGSIRSKLSEIFFDIHYVAQFKGQLDMMEWSLDDFRNECPEQWQQFTRYQENSLDLFYKFMTPEYYLFPKWVSAEKVVAHFEEMKKFAPFTIYATGSNTFEDIQSYQTKIIDFIKYLDVGLSKHA
ncbi:hypothetical protein DET64_10133 [Marinobacter nauticus]|uniref:DUF4760 domain-containing protein n=2 Tax=Marinobacter nauticus TaxID=2743 RepID=A0A368V910_MARNT|nr:hypothetical protein DET64_10133 [Marinobacter nauticus]RCW37697.1 hypothetical protein DET51_10133 [Marinobacter nauticus]